MHNPPDKRQKEVVGDVPLAIIKKEKVVAREEGLGNKKRNNKVVGDHHFESALQL